ncbi:MAG: MltA-interacting MipA family protein [Candidatus Eisenbacteria bacterium]|jgi:hypothetical protein|nr:MltA-interacting MipA family protein [Candidatus Eisenbacteria bacterium]
MRSISIGALIIGLLVGVPAQAAETTAGVDLVSAYVFRGVTYNDGPCLQPSLETSAGAFTFNVWANFDLNDYEPVQSGDFSEVDFTLSYGATLGAAELSLGVMEFLFPEGGPDTNTGELYASADIPVAAGIGASAYLGYDFVVVKDLYASVGLSYDIPIEVPTLSVSFMAGYAGDDAAAGGTAGLHEYAATIEGAYPFSEAVELGGFVTYTGGLDDEVLPEQDVEVFGGLKVRCAF